MSPFLRAVRQLALASFCARKDPIPAGVPAPHFSPYMDLGGLVA